MTRRESNPNRAGTRLAAAVLASLGLAVAVAACTGHDTTPPPAAAAAAPATASQDEVMGTVHICSSCHGITGQSISPTFPRLAGQQEAYLEAQLKAFRDHTRADPHAHTYMWGMAAHLTDPVIQGVATYFSSQAPAAPIAGDATLMAAGGKIFREGIPDRNVPVCASCHGDKALGMETIPRLASQHHDYLVEQLRNFQTKARANDVMDENAKNLTEEQIEQLATYLAAQ